MSNIDFFLIEPTAERIIPNHHELRDFAVRAFQDPAKDHILFEAAADQIPRDQEETQTERTFNLHFREGETYHGFLHEQGIRDPEFFKRNIQAVLALWDRHQIVPTREAGCPGPSEIFDYLLFRLKTEIHHLVSVLCRFSSSEKQHMQREQDAYFTGEKSYACLLRRRDATLDEIADAHRAYIERYFRMRRRMQSVLRNIIKLLKSYKKKKKEISVLAFLHNENRQIPELLAGQFPGVQIRSFVEDHGREQIDGALQDPAYSRIFFLRDWLCFRLEFVLQQSVSPLYFSPHFSRVLSAALSRAPEEAVRELVTLSRSCRTPHDEVQRVLRSLGQQSWAEKVLQERNRLAASAELASKDPEFHIFQENFRNLPPHL